MPVISRRTILAGVATFAGASLLPAPIGALGQTDDVQALLEESAAVMAALESFRFELETVTGTSTILDNLELKGVKGVVKRPDSFTADVTAGLAVIDLTVQVTGIGQRIWVTDPLSADGQQIELSLGDADSGAGSLAALVNPDRLFLAAVGLLENPMIDGTEKVDGVETTIVTGAFDAGKLIDLATPEALSAGGLPAELLLERMPVTIWIDDARRVVRLEIEGPLTSSETSDVIRGIDFYDFDTAVDIPEPTNVRQS